MMPGDDVYVPTTHQPGKIPKLRNISEKEEEHQVVEYTPLGSLEDISSPTSTGEINV